MEMKLISLVDYMGKLDLFCLIVCPCLLILYAYMDVSMNVIERLIYSLIECVDVVSPFTQSFNHIRHDISVL